MNARISVVQLRRVTEILVIYFTVRPQAQKLNEGLTKHSVYLAIDRN